MIRFQFPHGHPMARVAYTPDSLAVVTAQPHTGVFVRDRFTGQTLHEFPIPNAAFYFQLMVSPCGRFLIVGGGPQAYAFDLTAKSHPLLVSERARAVAFADKHLRCVAPNGFVADLSLLPPDGLVRSPDGGFGGSAPRTSGTIIELSADGRAGVAVRQRGKPLLVELKTGQTVAELSFPLRRTSAGVLGYAVFAPDGEKLALCDGERLAIFDLAGFDWATVPAKPKQLYPLCELARPDPTDGGTVKDKKAEHWLPPFAFVPDGRHFLTLGLRERVQLFDVKTGLVVEQWGWRMEDVTCLAVAPDGLTACAGGRRGKLTVWDLC